MPVGMDTFFIYNDFTASGTFNYNLQLRRTANKLVVKGIQFYADGTDNNIYTLTSNLISGPNQVLGYFTELRGSSPGVIVEHESNLYTASTYQFTVKDGSAQTVQSITGKLMVVLEAHYN